MKKLLAFAVVAMFSLNCMAGSHPRKVSVTNKSGISVDVWDAGRKGHDMGNTVGNPIISVDPGQTVSLDIRVHEPKGSWIPSSVMPHKTMIAVTDPETQGRQPNTIELDENDTAITVLEGLQMTKGNN